MCPRIGLPLSQFLCPRFTKLKPLQPQQHTITFAHIHFLSINITLRQKNISISSISNIGTTRNMSSSYAKYDTILQDFSAATSSSLAVVTGGKSGIGRSIANKIATFPFIDKVLVVSRSIQASDLGGDNAKLVPIKADVGTQEGRDAIVQVIEELKLPLRFLVHSAGTIDPIKPAGEVTPEEFQKAVNVNVEGPFFLSTSLYPYLAKNDNEIAGRILHVSSGAAHGAPPVGWGMYGITKAAFYQSFKVLDREFTQLGGKVRVGSFKPGIVDTAMQGTIRQAPKEAMPVVANFQKFKENAKDFATATTTAARPPPKGALDSPDNVAFFAEWLLLGTTDEEFANRNDPNEYDIRNAKLYPKWIPIENIPKEEEKEGN